MTYTILGSVRFFYRAEFGFQVQDHEQSTEADELADHHAKLENLFVTVDSFQAIEKRVVHVVVGNRQPIGVFDGE